LLLHCESDIAMPLPERRPTGFLARLCDTDFAQLKPSLELVEVTRGAMLVALADVGDFVYFSQGPLISLNQGNAVEVALVGSEGVVGWPTLVGCAASPFEATVCGRDGWIFRVRGEHLRALIVARPSIGLMLVGFINAVGLQMAETIGAAASHSLERRLARWILLRHDRMGGDEIPVHHDDIAGNLGTRRATITDTLHLLEGAGHVRGRRGRIIVRDRRGLESVAGGCYGSSEAFYRSVLGPFGKSLPSRADRVEINRH
jgi:CRP-like cAMP-binding protein